MQFNVEFITTVLFAILIIMLDIIPRTISEESQQTRRQNDNTEVFDELTTIYYDMNGKPVPLLSRSPGDVPSLKAEALNYGWLPCSCQESICGCCAHMNVNSFNFHRDACMNFTYVSKDFAINMDMLLDDYSLYHGTISGKNPPPACIPVTMLPGLSFCLRFHDMYPSSNNMHMCVNFETNYAAIPLLVLQFRCFKIGQDGFNLDPNSPANDTSVSSTPSTSSDVEIPPLGSDIYDEVTEEKKKISKDGSNNNSEIIRKNT
ncbi:hypothetical protein LSTR_LSTR003808 [Laodelphax striatellus]|uniref:DUF4773 domain-containing protein n=1 Tax=Laodelphax striatellus TaxID=195883 RepID=A0A482XFW9_LAOST|nr:hypothetical protein LSTR_LSTR003808 [Laodelphax striatellus]